MLEFFFLEQDNLGRLRNIDTNTTQALSFKNESKNLRVEVNIELVVVWVANDKSGLKTSFCFFDLDGPFLTPKILIGEQSVTNLVKLLDWLLVFTKLG